MAGYQVLLPAGEDEHVVRTEPSYRRVRVFFGGEAVADSSRTLLLLETGYLPVYYFPRDDVRFDLLEATSTSTHCPYKGDASYYTVIAGGSRYEDAVWAYPAPINAVPELKDYVAFYWDRADAWFEEDDQVFRHPRDPYHRIDTLNSSRHVEVRVNGELLADSHRPRLVFETALPVRYYLPKLDVRQDLLVPSDTRTRCPYKGEAVYWSVRVGGDLLPDLVWSYPLPIPEAPKLENLLCFFNEKVDITVDGVAQQRPVTNWS
jgi:uncharacterized protein (DUF427 family)